MPVILAPEAYSIWLDPGEQSPQRLLDLLVPAPENALAAVPVSDRVNSPAHDDPACVEPLA